MIGSKNKNLTDKVVLKVIEQGGVTIPGLISELEKDKDEKFTYQRIYQIVRQLIDEKVFIKNGKNITVTQEWKRRVLKILSSSYKEALNEGETVTYHFKDLAQLDAYWKHEVFQMADGLSRYPVFNYNPHIFWHFNPLRLDSEKEFYEYFNEGRYLFYGYGGNTFTDKWIAEKLRSDFVRTEISSSPTAVKRHFFILKDIIMITRLSKKLEEEIGSLFSSVGSEKDILTFTQKLQELIQKPSRCSLLIEKNKEKAKKLRKHISKNFYVPQDMVEEFSLW